MKSHEIYQYVTDTIITLLENHLDNWNKPWIGIDVDNDFARNPATKNYYRGINQFLLGFKMMNKGYLKNQWATFNQIKNMGGNVIKGSKSTPVIFYKTAYIDNGKNYYTPETVKTFSLNQIADKGIEPIPILKVYRVFNIAAQTENLDPLFYKVQSKGELLDIEKDERAENLLKSTGACIIERESNQAYYDRGNDQIVLPNRNQFQGLSESFYATAFHEIIHWTGAKHRLNREMGETFGDESYSKEELVAELGSAFLCAHSGFSKTITNNASYIKGWLSILRENPKYILSVSASAQKASDYLLSFSEVAGSNQLSKE